MPYLHVRSLSPDPTYGRPVAYTGDRQQSAILYPHKLLRAWPASPACKRWGDQLDLFRPAPALTLRPGGDGRAGVFLDFGTELDAELHLEINSPGRLNVLIWRGESIPEAEGLVRSDARFQRVWQTSVYTARLCTRPDTCRRAVGWHTPAHNPGT
jgi:hypothetical protein